MFGAVTGRAEAHRIRFAALYALLDWMPLVAALVALEKVRPWPRAARLATATGLAALTVGVLSAARDVPGLVVPGPSGARPQ